MMTKDRAPVAARALVADAEPMPWERVQERLEQPETPRTSWLATVRPDGRPHLMPLIAFWLDGALYFLTGQSTRKGRNLGDEPRCVIAFGSTALPSIDIIVEGDAQPVTDASDLRRVVEMLRANNWPLEIKGHGVHGPHAPTAGPPPYAVFRLVPSVVFGLPGMLGMEQFDPGDLPKPTRWEFG